MPKPIAGLHHVTAIASDPQANFDFYTRIMGLRLIKRTIHLDDPGIFHLYFGNDAATPGTILSFLCWPGSERGVTSAGSVSATAFSLPVTSLNYWEKRLAETGIQVRRTVRFEEEALSFEDPDGLQLEIVGHAEAGRQNPCRASNVPPEHALRGLFGVTLWEHNAERTAAVLGTMGFRKVGEEGMRIRFASASKALGNHIDLVVTPSAINPSPPAVAHLGRGSVHHVSFRAADEASQNDWRTMLIAASHDVTPVIDRVYFQSIYFREPGGVLFEVATDLPGFTVDEPRKSLGEALKLPPWMEPQRARVERMLPPFRSADLPGPAMDPVEDPHRDQPVYSQGASLAQASAAVILLHGRGGSAEDMFSLLHGDHHKPVAFLAPEAANHRWYPYSFMAPLAENEPWLTSALAKVEATIQLARDAGLPQDRIVLCGFSQGACLSTEFVARHPARYGGLVAWTGGLMGPPNAELRHGGDLAGMPAWFSSGDPDPHVPWSRVLASAERFATMGAEVHSRRLASRAHTVLPEEVTEACELMVRKLDL